jgi:hypothetical protein
MKAVMLIGVLAALASSVAAEEGTRQTTWSVMGGSEILAALTGRTLDYGAQWQDFRTSGRTLYHAGRDSWGYWAVRDDQYCSMWPPSDLWSCYAMQSNGERLRFVGKSGEFTEAVYKE